MDRDLNTLHDHTRVLARRWRLLVVFIVLGVAAGLGLSYLQKPTYAASALLLVQSSDSSQTHTSPAVDAEEVATQAQVVLSDAVARRVIQRLHLGIRPGDLLSTVTTTPATDKRVVLITATRPTAAGAAAVANGFARGYITLRNDQTKRADARARDSYVADLSSIQTRLNQLRKSGGKAADTQAEIQSLLARQAQLQASLLVADNPTNTPTVTGQVLQRASTPTSPSDPRPIRAGLLGGLLGLVVGVLVAYARDRADDTVHAGQRLGGIVGSVPVLGRIPAMRSERHGRVEGLVDPRSAGSEAHRTLSTNLRFLLAADPARMLEADRASDGGGIILVASAAPHEGKTSVAANLAVAAARTGLRVLLVDADMRNPSVAHRFGLDVPEGLADLLLDGQPVATYLQDVGVANLRLLPAGSVPPNPAELLASSRARTVWQELRMAADLIVVDTPPILRVADTLELARDADQVVIVMRDGHSRMRQVTAAVHQLRQVGGAFSGVVLNQITGKDGQYHYGYGQQPAPQTVVSPSGAPPR